jgi:uncharacterized repeat protein (TIGR01451 family)
VSYFLKNMRSIRKPSLSLRLAVSRHMQLIKILLSLLLAIVVTISLGASLPSRIDLFNDSMFGKVTILDYPELTEALKAAQDKGVLMAVHGYHHEDYRILDAETAKKLVERGVAVFEEAGLTPVAFYYPYSANVSDDVGKAVESVLPTRLPSLNVVDEVGDGDDLLEPGEIWVYTGNYTVTQAMIDSNGNGDPIDGKIHNTVTVNSDQTEEATADAAVPITQVTQGPSLDVTIVADPINMMVVAPNDRIDAGDVIPYTVRIRNTGSQNLTNVTVRDTLRSRLTRNMWGGDQDNNLGVGESWTYTSTYNITQAMIDSNGNGDPIDGKIHNTVIVDSDQTEVATADAAVPIVQGPFLNVIQTAGAGYSGYRNVRVATPKDRYDAGDTIPYTIRVYNMGSQTLTNIRVSDSLVPTLKRGTTVTGGFGTEYTFGWRDMESFDDPRYVAAKTQIVRDQPTSIMAHVYDWNSFSKQLITDYLAITNKTNISVRVDDIEPNTPVWKVTDMAELLNNDKVVRLSFGVISEGTWMGGDPHIFGISVNDIFRFYWIFFLVLAFFPLTFLLFWRILTRKHKNPGSNCGSLVNGPKDGKKPRVSVIVPAYNEEAHISSCLEAIQKQDYGGNMEVIVVNDGSTDRTAEIASKYPINLIDLKNNVGKANALNAGIGRSKGDILVFSDSDSELASNAVNLLVASLEEHPDVGAVAGNIYINEVERKNNLLKRFQMIEYCTDQEISRYLQSLSGDVLVCPGPLFAARRAIAEKTMFNDRSVIEDADFTIEVLKSNMKVLREPQAKAYTDAPLSLKSWFNQRKRWWYGNLQLWRIHNHWARKNPWMILTYFGFITGLVSLILALLLPYLFSTYDNIDLILLRGLAWAATPILLFTLLIVAFFVENQRLLLTLIPYALLYGIIKTVTLSYIYLRYIFRRGIKVTFGPRTIFAR